MPKNKGFASNPIIHKFLSSKGGKVRKPKGLAKLPPERRREIAAMGGRAKHNKEKRDDNDNDTGANPQPEEQ